MLRVFISRLSLIVFDYVVFRRVIERGGGLTGACVWLVAVRCFDHCFDLPPPLIIISSDLCQLASCFILTVLIYTIPSSMTYAQQLIGSHRGHVLLPSDVYH